MAGLVPAIHALASREKGVDARHKAGHDSRSLMKACVETLILERPHARRAGAAHQPAVGDLPRL
ncbi:MAG TPA: hypothetical protein VEC60_20405, partial [Reyranella sp.]|nr:hypothetical protein [Reyranella sp.]